MVFIYLFGVLRRFQHCTGHITMGRWKGRGNHIQLVKVLYCKLPTTGKQLPAFPLEVGPGTEPQPQRWEVRVLSLCHHGPYMVLIDPCKCHNIQLSKYIFCLPVCDEVCTNVMHYLATGKVLKVALKST